MKNFEQECRDLLEPLGFVLIWANHPNLPERKVDMIKNGIRIRCSQDKKGNKYWTTLAEFWHPKHHTIQYSLHGQMRKFGDPEVFTHHAQLIAERNRILKQSIFSRIKKAICHKLSRSISI